MGGTLDRAVGLGACLVPATARARQGTPGRGEGVAFKWIRIVFRRWQDRVAYDETRYLAVLAKRVSHLTLRLRRCGSEGVKLLWILSECGN